MIALTEICYVVDASVVIAHLISEKYTSHADALFELSGTTLALYISLSFVIPNVPMYCRNGYTLRV